MTDRLLELVKDVVNDSEFRYDFTIVDDDDLALSQVIDNPHLLKIVLISLEADYEHDIELEKSWGEDTEYLEVVLKEIKSLLK